MATDPGGFFSRWSRRKAEDTAQAQAAERAARPPVPATGLAVDDAGALAAPKAGQATAQVDNKPSGGEGTAPAASTTGPTLDDVRSLSADSDFKPFVGQAVAPEVRNAAMKKLFADPHFNVMDGLDIYIDDYSKPSPLPAELLRKMVSAQFLQMVEEEKPATGSAEPVPAQPPALPDPPALGAEAVSPVSPVSPPISAHDHPDLQLQPDHAPRRGGTEPGA